MKRTVKSYSLIKFETGCGYYGEEGKMVTFEKAKQFLNKEEARGTIRYFLANGRHAELHSVKVSIEVEQVKLDHIFYKNKKGVNR